MSYTGTILGAIIGLFVASLPGAIIGAGIGWFFCDRAKHKRAQAAKNIDPKQMILLSYSLMGYVARGAGRINEDQISKTKEIMAQMGLSEGGAQLAIEAFHQGKSSDFNVDEALRQLKICTGNDRNRLAYVLEYQIQIALADGQLSAEELRRLNYIGTNLGFTPESIQRAINARLAEMMFAKARAGGFGGFGGFGYSYGQQQSESYQQEQDTSGEHQYRHEEPKTSSAERLKQCYAILGVAEDASWEDIRKAHKRLMFKYHPDRLASQGLPPDMIAAYTKKAQDIQAAFNEIKEARGH